MKNRRRKKSTVHKRDPAIQWQVGEPERGEPNIYTRMCVCVFRHVQGTQVLDLLRVPQSIHIYMYVYSMLPLHHGRHGWVYLFLMGHTIYLLWGSSHSHWLYGMVNVTIVFACIFLFSSLRGHILLLSFISFSTPFSSICFIVKRVLYSTRSHCRMPKNLTSWRGLSGICAHKTPIYNLYYYFFALVDITSFRTNLPPLPLRHSIFSFWCSVNHVIAAFFLNGLRWKIRNEFR